MTVRILIPNDGPIHVFEDDRSEDPATALMAFEGKGPLAQICLEVDNKRVGTAFFLHDTTGPVNPRARRALAALTQVHMVLVGPVLFTGVARDAARDVVALLSMKEGAGD